jgi:hypothetical protein
MILALLAVRFNTTMVTGLAYNITTNVPEITTVQTVSCYHKYIIYVSTTIRAPSKQEHESLQHCGKPV